ncbi:hypothetical protein COO60DRAFT_1465825 [Scenedesmus sp. NREL 46B-D3]|nr:hypothetical protein COO60DRAFT_1465825 [Scenedesmus sp. NREL 46B-D3]
MACRVAAEWLQTGCRVAAEPLCSHSAATLIYVAHSVYTESAVPPACCRGYLIMGHLTLLVLSLAVIAVCCSAAEPTDEDLEVVIQQGCTNFSLTMAVFNGTAWVRPPYVRNKPHAVAYKDRASKAVIWRLRHAPIRGVTPAMVRWMWNHMDKQVADPRDGQKWQMFQLMHPSDHVGVKWDTKDLQLPPFPGDAPGNATQWVWSEVPASMCKVNTTHVECPANQPGHTCDSITAAALKKIATLNISMVASEMTSDVDEYGFEVAAITMRAVNYYIMHALQEWAALPQWLPKVYAAETGK